MAMPGPYMGAPGGMPMPQGVPGAAPGSGGGAPAPPASAGPETPIKSQEGAGGEGEGAVVGSPAQMDAAAQRAAAAYHQQALAQLSMQSQQEQQMATYLMRMHQEGDLEKLQSGIE